MKNWNEFDTKYRTVIGRIAKFNPMGENAETDLGNARLMLVHMVECRTPGEYSGVPVGFNWQGCREDVTAIRDAEKENR